jgi:hypothetical protein
MAVFTTSTLHACSNQPLLMLLVSAVEFGVFDLLQKTEAAAPSQPCMPLSAMQQALEQSAGKPVSSDGLSRLLHACVALGLLAKEDKG